MAHVLPFLERAVVAFVRVFAAGYNPLWHLAAVALTAACVSSGFDWWYFTFWYETPVYYVLFTAGIVGFFVPVAAPIALWIAAWRQRSMRYFYIGMALMQSALLGVLVSWFYKSLTGREHPYIGASVPLADISQVFRFGFLEGGVLWGWPSSHTAVAFAIAVTIFVLFRHRTLVRWSAMAYALYIGIGASMGFHWFSDFVAGAIFGSLIGFIVAEQYRHILTRYPTDLARVPRI